MPPTKLEALCKEWATDVLARSRPHKSVRVNLTPAQVHHENAGVAEAIR
jgi:hypothetical protein